MRKAGGARAVLVCGPGSIASGRHVWTIDAPLYEGGLLALYEMFTPGQEQDRGQVTAAVDLSQAWQNTVNSNTTSAKTVERPLP